MRRKVKDKKKAARPKTKLGLPDLDHSKAAVLASLRSPESQRGYRHAIDEFIARYCSEPRLSFNKTVVTRYRTNLEIRQLAAGTINVRLAAVRRLAYEAADSGLLSPELAAGIRRVKGAKTSKSRSHSPDWMSFGSRTYSRRISDERLHLRKHHHGSIRGQSSGVCRRKRNKQRGRCDGPRRRVGLYCDLCRVHVQSGEPFWRRGPHCRGCPGQRSKRHDLFRSNAKTARPQIGDDQKPQKSDGHRPP